MGFLIALFSICIGACIGAVIEGLGGTPKMVTAIVFGVLALFLGIWIVMHKVLWPNKENWKGCLGETLARKGKESDNWKFDKQQEVGDYFMLSIQKGPNDFVNVALWIIEKVANKVKPWWIRPWNIGKARVIDRIEFMKGDYPADSYPKRYAVTLSGLHGILPNWNERQLIEKSFGDNIIIEFEHPEKVTLIAVKIIEPRPNRFWATGEIRIREIRLFGRFWKVTIK